MRANGILFILLATAALAVASAAPAGGIDDQPCPNVAGENTNTCPSGTVGTPYAIRFLEREGSGCGPGRQTFHLDSGLAPPGLTLERDGTFGGVPELSGRFRFYVEMREPENDPASCAGRRTQKQFTLSVRNPVSVVSAPVAPIRSEVGAPFRTILRARGGTGIFAWAVVGGELPPGVNLTRHGTIVGAPRAPGTYAFTARARDTEKRTTSWAGTLQVAPRLLIRTQRLRAARVGRRYSVELAAAGGVDPKTWRILRGRLPRGISLAANMGRLTGIPKVAGSYRIHVRVRDRLGVESTRSFTLAVRAATRPRAEDRSPRARERSGTEQPRRCGSRTCV